MISKQYRFHRRNAVNYVHKAGKSVRGNQISLRHVDNNQQLLRVAVIVSKKTAKSAVMRNRIRRRIFAAMQPLIKKGLAPMDMVFMVYSKTVAVDDFAAIEKEVSFLVGKAQSKDVKKN